VSTQEDEIDSAILAMASRRKTAGRIVGAIALDFADFGQKVAPETIAARVALLVKEGRLIAHGDIKDWRTCDVVTPGA
jgi:hypothetical protein